MESKWSYRIAGAILFPLLNFVIFGIAIGIDAANDPEYYEEDSGEEMATAAVFVMLSLPVVWAIAGGVIGEFVRQRRVAARTSSRTVDAPPDDFQAPVMIRE
jgi:hypothetical protein